ncbi:ALP1-like protein [Tanacetum coccineum]
MNSEAIMLPDVEDLYAKQEVVHRDMNFFCKALSFLICLPQPKRQKRTNIDRDHYGAHDRLVEAYFSEHLMFSAKTFEESFRMRRKLFTSIVEEVTIHCKYFREKKNYTGRVCISPLFKCTSAIHQLTYDNIPDARDEYLQMGEATSRLSLEQICRPIMEIFGQEYLRSPTITNIEKLYAHHEQTHMFLGMLGSPYTYLEWFGCPIAYKAQYCRRDHVLNSFILLEVVASQDLWKWRAFFGVSGTNNDINVIYQSLLLNDLKNGKAP